MLSSLLAKTTCIKPFVGSLSESTQVRYRWYKDMLENKRLKRRGYTDQTKQEGPLPRLRDDSMPLTVLPSYKAKNSWAEHKALAGQNDYIDILGSDEIHPKQIMYHVPHYLRGIHKNDNYFKMMIKRRDHYANTPLPKAHPSKWAGWNQLMMHEYRRINRHQDQNWWANYKGIKEGPVKNPFKKKLF